MAPQPSEPDTVESIRNLLALGPRLATGGQPSEAQLAALAARGFDAVVNLGLLDPRYCLPDEAASCAALGLDYHHIPVDFRAPQPGDFERFRATLRRLDAERVFVHCAMNYRVSCFVALYGECELGWSREQTDAHVRSIWQPDAVWTRFLAQMRAGFGADDQSA